MSKDIRAGSEHEVPLWRRALAYWWYAWGLSWCHWGLRTSEQSFFRAGVRAFDRAVRLWPHFATAFYRRGLIRGRELSDHRAALADLTRAIELAPDWPPPYLQRGLFQRFHGDQRAALDDLLRYVALSDDRDWRAEAERQITMIRAELDEEGQGEA
jgi:tetratricopeptide (TPR) repeat protein